MFLEDLKLVIAAGALKAYGPFVDLEHVTQDLYKIMCGTAECFSVLTLKSEPDKIKVSFHEGSVVWRGWFHGAEVALVVAKNKIMGC